MTLPAWMIEEIWAAEKEQSECSYEQLQLQLPMYEELPVERPKEPEASSRVIVIEL